jgi:hypothetical protein
MRISFIVAVLPPTGVFDAGGERVFLKDRTWRPFRRSIFFQRGSGAVSISGFARRSLAKNT